MRGPCCLGRSLWRHSGKVQRVWSCLGVSSAGSFLPLHTHTSSTSRHTAIPPHLFVTRETPCLVYVVTQGLGGRLVDFRFKFRVLSCHMRPVEPLPRVRAVAVITVMIRGGEFLCGSRYVWKDICTFALTEECIASCRDMLSSCHH